MEYVNKNIPPNSCVAGVPARVYSKFDDFINHHMEMIKLTPFIDYNDLNSPAADFKEKVKKMLDENQIYIKGYQGKFPWTLD